MRNDDSWWPLVLTARANTAVAEMESILDHYTPNYNLIEISRVAKSLEATMERHVVDIEDRDTMPQFCHVINGWGNATRSYGRLIDGYARYFQPLSHGKWHIVQKGTEGDFHPWQSFAYALMAGVAPETPIGDSGRQLFQIAMDSRSLDTDDGCELGHLLYAAAEFGLDLDTEFSLKGRTWPLRQLVAFAVDAHHDGHFKVCRKYHLTEGLCAMVGTYPELEPYRVATADYLNGQLDLLVVLASVLHQCHEAVALGQPLHKDATAVELRDALAIDGLVENHYYLAGHALELLALAKSYGFQITPQQWNAGWFCMEQLNSLLDQYLPQVWFPGCFLHFGHYRRAISLMQELAQGSRLDRAALSRYTSDFSRATRGTDEMATLPRTDDGVYSVWVEKHVTRRAFASVVRAYRSQSPTQLEPRGDGPHFRRVLVQGWPRWLHFELLDYGARAFNDRYSSGFGVEIHVEQQHPGLLDALRAVHQRIQLTDLPSAELDPQWWGNSGRLRLWYPDDTPPEVPAAGLRELIDTSLPILEAELSRAFTIQS